MWRTATVHAYDVMDQIFISVSVRATTEDRSETIESELRLTTTIEGVGEDDPREWLRDVLLAALESI
jgi:hypothetical protein